MLTAAMQDARKRPVALVGAGALGTALAQRLAAAGYSVDAVLSRTESAARALARAVQAPVFTTHPAYLPASVRLVVCCVPDDAVPEVAMQLARLDHAWSETVVAHTAGALTAEALAPLMACGAKAMSFHPVQTFPPGASPARFDDIVIGLEGDDRAVAVGRQMALDLGAHPLVLSGEAKACYHLAASVASNFFVTLMALASEVLTSIGLTRPESAALLRPLVEGTWRALQDKPPEDVLTGPIARGDVATVERHTQALAERLPHLLPVYAALGTEAVRVAVRGAHLSPEDAQRVLEALHAAVEPPQDSLFDE